MKFQGLLMNGAVLGALVLTTATWNSCGRSSKPKSDLTDFQDFTVQQRVDDFNYIAGIFEEHYAMLDYKQARYGFKWADLRAQYLQRISADGLTREQFIGIMQEFVAQFRDAHTSSLVLRDGLLEGGEVKLTTLGFATERVIKDGKNVAKVSRVYDRFFSGSDQSPVRKDDIILAINGKDVETIIREDITKFRDLGQPEANLTMGYRYLVNRFNILFGQMPDGPADVKVKRGDNVIDLRLKWIKTGLAGLGGEESSEEGKTKAIREIVEIHPDGTFIVKERSSGASKLNNLLVAPTNGIFARYKMAYQMDVALAQSLDGSIGHDYPAAATDIDVDGLKFKLIGSEKGLMAFYRVEDFTWSRFACGAWQELSDGVKMRTCHFLKGEDYAKAFKKLKNLGVKGLILDLRSNGGGFLNAGYELARAFFKGAFATNLAGIRLNEEWVGEIKSAAESESSSTESRDAFQRAYAVIQSDISANRRLSSPISIMGKDIETGADDAWEGKTFVVVDEMCASMCDIFSTLMQDHKRATVLGKQSMGAGGNVIGFAPSIHTKIMVNQTASVMYRLDGSIIENEGAKPDVVFGSTVGEDFWKELISAASRDL